MIARANRRANEVRLFSAEQRNNICPSGNKQKNMLGREGVILGLAYKLVCQCPNILKNAALPDCIQWTMENYTFAVHAQCALHSGHPECAVNAESAVPRWTSACMRRSDIIVAWPARTRKKDRVKIKAPGAETVHRWRAPLDIAY